MGAAAAFVAAASAAVAFAVVASVVAAAGADAVGAAAVAEPSYAAAAWASGVDDLAVQDWGSFAGEHYPAAAHVAGPEQPPAVVLCVCSGHSRHCNHCLQFGLAGSW